MVEKSVTIVNDLGMHARPSAALVEITGRHPCDVRVSKDGGDPVNGKSILGIMTLAAEQGSTLLISCDGPGEDEVLQEMIALVEKGFDE
jgi:phosphocarrier protein HPr